MRRVSKALPHIKHSLHKVRTFHHGPWSQKKKRLVLGTYALILGIVVLFVLYQLVIFIMNYPVLSALDRHQGFSPKTVEKDPVLSSINNIIELPDNENGTVGIIKNVSALTKQKDFF